jgi:hypothetical protein
MISTKICSLSRRSKLSVYNLPIMSFTLQTSGINMRHYVVWLTLILMLNDNLKCLKFKALERYFCMFLWKKMCAIRKAY